MSEPLQLPAVDNTEMSSPSVPSRLFSQLAYGGRCSAYNGFQLIVQSSHGLGPSVTSLPEQSGHTFDTLESTVASQ